MIPGACDDCWTVQGEDGCGVEVFRSVVQARESGLLDGGTALTIGNFDGVHKGHLAVLKHLVTLAQDKGLASLAVTFSPHPAMVHNPDHAPELITGEAEKIRRLAATGIDAVLIQPYSLDFAQQTADEFVRDYLVGKLGAKAVFVGEDTRFGKDNAGGVSTLEELSTELGFVMCAPLKNVGTGGERYSSTEIRSLLARGEVAAAAAVLGRRHVLEGTVVHGDARGREMGFPTANMGMDVAGLIPADGVYAGWLRFDDSELLPGAISIGTNPTFEGNERRVEAHVVGVEFGQLDVYGTHMRIEFESRIRGQVTFDGMDALIVQMGQDLVDTRAALGI
jgi:riboflavin kinase/FMN adenylyltransferase